MHAIRQRLRRILTRNLVRCGKEQNIYAMFTQALPGKGLQWKSAIAADVRIKLVQPRRARALTFTRVEDRPAHPGVAESRRASSKPA